MSSRMKAGVLHGPGDMRVLDVTRPVSDGERVLVRVLRTGICTFERRLYSGAQGRIPMPVIAGHEVAGIVEAAPDGSEFEAGDVVALDLVYRCGTCRYCVRGHNNQCVRIHGERIRLDDINVVGGGFGEYLAVAPPKLVTVAPGVPVEAAALAEPLACVLHSIGKTRLGLGDTVAVIGGGTMGSLHAIVAKTLGCAVAMIDLDERRLEFARARLGVDLAIDAAGADPVGAARALSGGHGVDAVFVTAAVAVAAQQAIDMAAKYATVVLYAAAYPPVTIEVDWNRIHYDEIRIDGTEGRTLDDFRRAVAMLGHVDLDPVVSRQVGLDDLPAELERGLPTGDTQRVLVNMEA